MKRLQQALVWWANLSLTAKVALQKAFFPDKTQEDLTSGDIQKIYLSVEEEE